MESVRVILLLLVSLCLVVVPSTTYIVQKASNTGAPTSQLKFSKFFSEGYNTTGYLAIIPNPINHFHFFYSAFPNRTCGGHEKTSVQAYDHSCQYATNGGPFSFNSGYEACMGFIVSNSTVVELQQLQQESFGLTKSGDWVMGLLTTADVLKLGFAELVTGFGWLLQNSVIIPTPGGEIAPRTSIGTNAAGNLLIFEADGDETTKQGLTDHQAAVWFKSLGAINAISLDGGGSSVTYYHGNVVSHPTCHDVPTSCERAVVTITCVID